MIVSNRIVPMDKVFALTDGDVTAILARADWTAEFLPNKTIFRTPDGFECYGSFANEDQLRRQTRSLRGVLARWIVARERGYVR